MKVQIRAYSPADICEMNRIWNSVVADGVAFPQTELLNADSGAEFYAAQSHTGVAVDAAGKICGMYILHPNNIGRCGHICNASYAVDKTLRGQGIGEALVRDCLKTASELGFRILQFNAVVSTNTPALKLYKKLGFVRLGTIPGGFKMDDGTWADIVPHYINLMP